MCPHTATYVSSYCCVCGLAQICHGIIQLTKQTRSTFDTTRQFLFLLFVVLERANIKNKNAGQCYEKLGMLPEAEAHIRDASRCMRPYVSSVCGIKFLVYEALSYWCMRPEGRGSHPGRSQDLQKDCRRH